MLYELLHEQFVRKLDALVRICGVLEGDVDVGSVLLEQLAEM